MKGPWKFGQQAMMVSLVFNHVWGTMLIFAVMNGKDSLVVANMFEAVGFSIGWILMVLVAGKGWKEFAPLKWGQPSTEDKPEEPPK